MTELFDRIKIDYKKNELLAPYTGFRIGGPADFVVFPENAEQLSFVLKEAKQRDIPFAVLGNGTNVLVSDEGFRGVVVFTAHMNELFIHDTTVQVGAGVLLSKLASQLAAACLTGGEFLQGIPGSVGGGLFMNCGAYDGEIGPSFCSGIVVNSEGDIHKVENASFSYRCSDFMKNDEIICSATLEFRHGDQSEIRERMRDFSQRRRAKQPLEYPSAGSFFKRPQGAFAGKLIEDAGLKGASCGDAQVSEKHAGFLINRGNATASDIIRLMNKVQSVVFDRFGVQLEPEVRFVGEF